MKKVNIRTTGMTCHGCEANVVDALSEVAGVKKSKASFKTGIVEVEYDETKTSLEELKKAINGAGYKAE